MSEIKRTPLYDIHVSLDAKLTPFAGFEMPVRYSSLSEEHMSVRNSVGVFDVSHMGEFFISGNGALDLIQKVSSNDASVLEIGQAQYTCLPNNEGGIVDDMILYRLGEKEYMCVPNASNIQKDWDWINKHNSYGATLRNASDDYALLAVQGPKAVALLQELTEIDLSSISYYHFVHGTLAGIPDILISATGYTGSGGFELYVPADKAKALWKAIFSIDTDIDVQPAGLGARDTLRLEMGFCLYGNDIDDTTSPIEAGLGWITKFNHDFVNSSFLAQQKQDKPTRRLAGFELTEKGIPRQGYEIISAEGAVIGQVTSGTLSPMLDTGIGMGYIDVPHNKSGTNIFIQIRKKQVPAIVKRPPFVTLPKNE